MAPRIARLYVILGACLWVAPIVYQLTRLKQDEVGSSAMLEQSAILTGLAVVAAVLRARWGDSPLSRRERFSRVEISTVVSMTLRGFYAALIFRRLIDAHSGLSSLSIVSGMGLSVALLEYSGSWPRRRRLSPDGP